MPTKVEQLNKDNIVEYEYDQILSRTQLIQHFNALEEFSNSSSTIPYECSYKGTNITLLIKNISYLGNPHLIYKKRIQIPRNWHTYLQDKDAFLIGVYHYQGSFLYCLFDTTNYRNNQINNSSAHIYTIDLLKARQLGIFQKKDKNDNMLTVFTAENISKVFDSVLLNAETLVPEEFRMFSQYVQTLHKEWYGIDCYKEMQEDNFSQAYQAEWAGFYNEYRFEKYLRANDEAGRLCEKITQKTDGTIDLDLWFVGMQCYGDLKTHTVTQDLLGNDKNNFFRSLEQYGKVWYLVISHETLKDKQYREVTRYWNESINRNQGKNKSLDSYLSRMKNKVFLKYIFILEVNHFNKQYLSDFNQGRNSDGAARNSKIKIKKSDLKNDNFVIYRESL